MDENFAAGVVQRIAEGRGHELDRAVDQIAALEAERDELRVRVEQERNVNAASGCPDCGVHAGCFEVVRERDRLRLAYSTLVRAAEALRPHADEFRFPSGRVDSRVAEAALGVLAALELGQDETASSPYYVSPVDGHDHFTRQGRRECAVCSAEAERDRLRRLLGNGEGYDSLEEWIGALQGEVLGLREELALATESRDDLRAVVKAYQRTYHALDHDLDDNNVNSVGSQFDDWKAAQDALLEMPTADAARGDM